MKLNDDPSKVSPKYTSLDKLKTWIERRYKVKIIGHGINYNGWPTFDLEDGNHIPYVDDMWTPTRELRKHTLYYCYESPKPYPDWVKNQRRKNDETNT